MDLERSLCCELVSRLLVAVKTSLADVLVIPSDVVEPGISVVDTPGLTLGDELSLCDSLETTPAECCILVEPPDSSTDVCFELSVRVARLPVRLG